ncbi:hypothetical protein D3C87_1485400 [compost metagenome]
MKSVVDSVYCDNSWKSRRVRNTCCAVVTRSCYNSDSCFISCRDRCAFCRSRPHTTQRHRDNIYFLRNTPVDTLSNRYVRATLLRTNTTCQKFRVRSNACETFFIHHTRNSSCAMCTVTNSVSKVTAIAFASEVLTLFKVSFDRRMFSINTSI